MKDKRRELNERMIAFRDDYIRANARINFLLANGDRGDELEQLEQEHREIEKRQRKSLTHDFGPTL